MPDEEQFVEPLEPRPEPVNTGGMGGARPGANRDKPAPTEAELIDAEIAADDHSMPLFDSRRRRRTQE